ATWMLAGSKRLVLDFQSRLSWFRLARNWFRRLWLRFRFGRLNCLGRRTRHNPSFFIEVGEQTPRVRFGAERSLSVSSHQHFVKQVRGVGVKVLQPRTA